MPSRWDHLFDLKPVPLVEHVLDEVSKLVAKDLSGWPLQVEEFHSAADAERFRPLLEPAAPRPDDKVFTIALRLARLELLREYEQIDAFMRNERWREFTPPGYGYDAMIFISRFLVEQMLALGEATQGRIKRPQLVECLLRAEHRLKAASQVIVGV